MNRLLCQVRLFFTFYLGMTRRERMGILVFYPLGILFYLASYLYDHQELHHAPIEDFQVALTSLNATENHTKKPKKRLTPFDPDTISRGDLIAFGLPEGVAGAWTGYREAAGGKITKRQIRNLFGMNDSLFKILSPFLTRPLLNIKTVRKITKPQFEPIDMNLSDTTLWQSLRGIGPVLSKRTVAYRELLGGFVHKNQIREVYGIDSSLYERISSLLYVSPHFLPRKLNISTDTYAQLRAHPYISPRAASAIVHYRSQHGQFSSVNELYAIKILDSAIVNRIIPYVLKIQPVNKMAGK